MRPILVVGTGRSGTSTTTRILHEHLGVMMVREMYLPGDRWNPRGYYEDKKMKLFVKQAVNGAISPEVLAMQTREWMTQGEDIRWGFKVTQISNGTPALLDALDPSLIIVCMRDRDLTAKSIVEWRRSNWKLDEAAGYRKFDQKMTALMKFLHGRQVLWLDFSEQRDERELKLILRDALPVDIPDRGQRCGGGVKAAG